MYVKNSLLLAGFLISLHFGASAQWQLSGTTETTTGNVGIGTTTPRTVLDVAGISYLNRPSLMVDPGTTLGIPNGAYLNIAPSDLSSTNNSYIVLRFPDNNSFRLGTGYDGHLGTGIYRDLQFGRYYGDPYMIVKDGGNVLIGKTSQTNTSYMLDVNGATRANKVVVNVTGADFVFDTAYKLPALETVERYVLTNHHLDGIAPAKQMETEGLDLGGNQTQLLQKIEELTLYAIAQQKEIQTQAKQIDGLKQQNAQLAKQQQQIDVLTQQLNTMTQQLNALTGVVKKLSEK